MRFLFIIPLLSSALLCSASLLPPRVTPYTIRAYHDSLTLFTSIRQGKFCFSQQDCLESELCAQAFGEPFCQEDCEGVCILKSQKDVICNCDDPCEEGKICINIFTNSDVDNGMCVSSLLAESAPRLECPESDRPESNRPNSSFESEEPTASEEPSKSEDSGLKDSDDPGASGKPDEDSDPPGNTEPEDSDSEPMGPSSGSDNSGVEAESEEDESEPDTTPGPENVNSDDTAPADSGDTTEGVCIGANMLDKFKPHQLVFPKHVLSRALCDAHGSCATKGHIVTYEGSGMMMSSYCSIVGCTEKVMLVNSPKYQARLRVASRSGSMEFTSFAARFGTLGEEVVLRAAVRLGF